MKIKILGSGQEVGRSSIVLDESVMMDCGVKIEPSPPQYPNVEKVGSAIISHAHLDHIGATPLLTKKWNTKVFMNDITLELGIMLLKDSIKVAYKEGYGTPFTIKDTKQMIRSAKIVAHKEKFRIDDKTFSLWPSGHVPGSSSILAEKDNGKRIFYTSDIQTTDSRLMGKCQLPEHVDTLIVESTYGFKDHPPRERVEKELVTTVEDALASNEVALFPVFSIGRAQEVMMILQKFGHRVAIDGMAKLASEIIADYDSYIKDPHAYRSVLKKVAFIRSREDRLKAVKRHSIIISSAGMLGGGPAVHYLKEISKRRGSKVMFTGFLIEDSPGRHLIETKIFKNTEEEFNVHCDVHQYELSAHTDRSGIFGIINRTKPKQVICVHGDRCKELAKDIEEHFKVQAFAPKNGETVNV